MPREKIEEVVKGTLSGMGKAAKDARTDYYYGTNPEPFVLPLLFIGGRCSCFLADIYLRPPETNQHHNPDQPTYSFSPTLLGSPPLWTCVITGGLTHAAHAVNPTQAHAPWTRLDSHAEQRWHLYPPVLGVAQGGRIHHRSHHGLSGDDRQGSLLRKSSTTR